MEKMAGKQITIKNFFSKKSTCSLNQGDPDHTSIKPRIRELAANNKKVENKRKKSREVTKSKTLTPNKEFVPPTPERENVEPVIVTNRISELPANNKKGENKQKKSREVTKSKTITPEKEFVPPTPERENVIPVIVIDDHATLHSMSTKKRLNLINSTLKKLQKLKNANNIDNGMKISHPQNKLKTTECLEVKDTILVEKTEEKKQSTKRLSLSKPLKRKCSFSGKDDQKKLTLVQNAVKVDQINGDNEMLSGYIGNTNTSILKSSPLHNKSHEDIKLTNIKSKQRPVNLDDSFIDLLDDIDDISSKKDVPETINITGDSDVLCEDSLLGIDFDNCEDINLDSDVKDPSVLLLWKIQQVRISTYEQSNGFKITEKILHLVDTKVELEATCHLRDDWSRMEVEAKDLAYVSALCKNKLHCILDNKTEHHITLYPNTLISGTTIAAGISCERQAIFNERFKMEKQNEAMLLGTITHDLFEWALRTGRFSADKLERKARENLTTIKYLDSLYAIGIDETQILDKIRQYYVPMETWWKDFLSNSSGKVMEFKTGEQSKKDDDSITSLHIDKIVDIEENVWSPTYGLKGKIDLSVNVTVHRKPRLNGIKTKNNYTLPLELKTGKMFSKLGSIEHRAQVAVYTLLMSDRYKQHIDAGLLCYIKSNHMQGVPRPEQEKRAILIKRNEIARKLTLEKNDFALPGLVRNERQCSRCYQRHNCMLYFKAMENGEAWSSGVDELFTSLTTHLTDEDCKFFSKWYRLSMLEASYNAAHSKSRYLWRESSEEREKHGYCFSGMQMIREDETSDEKIHYVFQRKDNHSNFGTSLKSIPLVVGTRVIISEEKCGVFNITTGYIIDIREIDITISASQKITQHQQETVYRIDKDETLSSYSTPLSNLSKLLSPESPRDEKLRKLVIRAEAPSFCVETSDAHDRSYDEWKIKHDENLDAIYSQLNTVQKQAVKKCLIADDYVMILGMPGAGKSTTIACLVRALVAMGKSVLLTSYTHSAVDTILLKLLNFGFDKFLRVGQTTQLHQKIRPYSVYEGTKGFTSTHQLREFYNSKNVVATTCLGINHPIFMHKTFDYCIVDEASQITQPVCLGPIRYANVFVLVGDHNQLPPLVQSAEARKNGLDVSLFLALSELHPKAVVTLDHQYRMNKDIMVLTNELVYGRRMRCGNEVVADARLNLPFYQSLCETEEDPASIELLSIINPAQPVVFVNTEEANLTEFKSAAYIVNKGEAVFVKRIVELLLRCGLHHRDLGVVSPYRHQLKVIREEISSVSSVSEGFIEVDTIDKYQGKDRSCIIVSLVRSNNQSEVGDLLKDWRRINVAITRAKTKLILIGCRKTIIASEIFKKLINIIDTRKWSINMTPPDTV